MKLLGRKKRVVVVDDSAFMRKLISEIINSNDEFTVVAKLRNGRELINEVEKLNPDVITLDLEMPDLDGIETLKELKKMKNDIPVMMISSNTKKGSIKTMECLYYGAIDFITKPSGQISLNIKNIEDELIEKLKVVAKKNRSIYKSNGQMKNLDGSYIKLKNEILSNKKFDVDILVIGASTGGPRAIQKILEGFDETLNKPILVVQHMPVGFTKAFAERLNKICKLKVVEAEDGMKIENNTVYIAKGGIHMEVGRNKKIVFSSSPTLWGVRPAVDKLFNSVAEVYNEKVISIILTGMGKDGANGTKTIKNSGGVTIAQSEETCIIFGMPQAAILTGKVDYILDLDKISCAVKELIR